MSVDVSAAAWRLVRAAALLTPALQLTSIPGTFRTDAGQDALSPAPANDADLAWDPGSGWSVRLAPDDPRAAFVDLYLPLLNATPAHPITVGHLGRQCHGPQCPRLSLDRVQQARSSLRLALCRMRRNLLRHGSQFLDEGPQHAPVEPPIPPPAVSAQH